MPTFEVSSFISFYPCDSLGREPLCNLKKLRLDFENRPLLNECVFIEILYEKLRNNVEILLIVFKNFLYQVINLIDVLELELVVVNQSHNFNNFLF